MYPTVPTRPLTESPSLISIARPKSDIRTWPRSSKRMFSGLQSRYTMPCKCKCSNPHSTCKICTFQRIYIIHKIQYTQWTESLIHLLLGGTPKYSQYLSTYLYRNANLGSYVLRRHKIAIWRHRIRIHCPCCKYEISNHRRSLSSAPNIRNPWFRKRTLNSPAR